MNERLDAILSEYEEAWRAAALADRTQFFGMAYGGIRREDRGSHGSIACAVLIPGEIAACRMHQPIIPLSWTCPTCGYAEAVDLWGAMVHTNNAHHWTWDMFANKFRDALAQGMTS